MGYSFNKVCSSVLPKGTYKVQITDIKFKTSSTGISSNDMVVHYTVAEGPCAKRTLNETISEKAFSFKLKPFLQAIGLDCNREFPTAKELYEWGIKEAKGRFLLVEVSIREYNGVEYNNITDYKAIPGSTTTTEEVLAEFETSNNLMPEKPTLADIPEVSSEDISAPQIDVADDDLPF